MHAPSLADDTACQAPAAPRRLLYGPGLPRAPLRLTLSVLVRRQPAGSLQVVPLPLLAEQPTLLLPLLLLRLSSRLRDSGSDEASEVTGEVDDACRSPVLLVCRSLHHVGCGSPKHPAQHGGVLGCTADAWSDHPCFCTENKASRHQ